MENNSVLELLEERKTLRKFSTRLIEPEKEKAILDAALRAPSGSNLMRYSIIRIDDKELRMALQRNCKNQPYISKAPLMLVFCADHQRYMDFYEDGRVEEKCKEIGAEFRYPDESSFLLAAVDATLAAHNAVLAAESMGLGSCYLGHIISHIEDNRDLMQLPPYVFPVLAVIFGYQAEDFRRVKSSRFDGRYLIHENTYKRLSPEELKEMFSKRFTCPQKNRYGAINNAQYSYINKYCFEPAYKEMGRSVREILKNWHGDNIVRKEEDSDDI